MRLQTPAISISPGFIGEKPNAWFRLGIKFEFLFTGLIYQKSEGELIQPAPRPQGAPKVSPKSNAENSLVF